jgi:hypothetical protein
MRVLAAFYACVIGRLRRWRPLAVAISAALVVGCLTTPVAALAQRTATDTWTGAGDETSWTDAMNWSAGVPQSGDSVTIAPTEDTPMPDVTEAPSVSLQDLSLSDASLSGGGFTVAGDFAWNVDAKQQDVLSGSLTVQGSATFSGAGQKDSQSPMTFDGGTDVTGGLLMTEDTGAAITNTGTFTISPGATVQADVCCVAQDDFVNDGTLAAPAASGTATLGWMNLKDDGSVTVGSGDRLQVTIGPVELKPGSGIGGGGTLDFDQDASVVLASGISIAAGSTVELAGGAQFTGTGSLTGAGRFRWTGGTVAANLTVGKSVSTIISGKSAKEVASAGSKPVTLTLDGATTLSGTGQLELNAGNIANSGRFTISPGSTVMAEACCVSPDKFTNTGTLAVPGSKSLTATLAWTKFADQGSVSVGKGSRLEVTVGPVALSGGAPISGGGTLDFDQDASVGLASNVSIGTGTTVQLTGGATVTGTGSFAGDGAFLWTGGTVAGNLTVGKSVSTTISGSSAKLVQSEDSKPVTLTLDGATTLSGTGPLNLNAGNITNSGTFTAGSGTAIAGLVCCVAPDQVRNTGRFVVAAAKKSAAVSALAFTNSGSVTISSGTLAVSVLGYDQTAGRTAVAGGSLDSPVGVTIAGGTLTGHGKITGPVLNSGTVSPSTTGGVLTISGSYRQTKHGELATVISGTKAGRSFGQLVVDGSVALAGTLDVTAVHFKPKPKETFIVMVYRTRSGKFAVTRGKPAYKVSYPGSVRIEYP